MNKTEYIRIAGNSKVKWHCTRTDCVDAANQPITLLSFQMSSVLVKLDNLLSKIDVICTDVAVIKNEVASIHASLADLEPRVDRVEDRVSSLENMEKINSNPEATIAEINERSRDIMLPNLVDSTSHNLDTKFNMTWNTSLKLSAYFLHRLTVLVLRQLVYARNYQINHGR